MHNLDVRQVPFSWAVLKRVVQKNWTAPYWLARYLLDHRHSHAQCGHRTKRVGLIAEGDTDSYAITLLPRQPRLCLDCLVAHTIPCAWCGHAIMPGSPIALRTPIDPAYAPPVGTYVYSQEPLAYVGCLRMTCSDGCIDHAGFWEPPIGVRRISTAIELMLDHGVVIHDTHDPQRRAELFPMS